MKVFYLFSILFILQSNVSLSQRTYSNTFMFGHSLMNYESSQIEVDEGKIAHWIYLLAIADSNEFYSTGQFGFLLNHINLPPSPNWGYQLVPSTWDIDAGQTFEEADFTDIMITPANFIQWQASNLPFPNDPNWSPLTATETIFDWMVDREELNFYIYENWPDMAPYLSDGPPASLSEFFEYNQYTSSDFHNWWLEYQDLLIQSRPDSNVKLIPVGSVMSKLYQEVLPGQIEVIELYEDDAPHGTATTYFLAGLISYMAIFERKAIVDFQFPSTIHPAVVTNFKEIVEFVWKELLDFNYPSGQSRVFVNEISSSEDEFLDANTLTIFPNPVIGNLQIKAPIKIRELNIYDVYGRKVYTMESPNTNHLDIHNIVTKTGCYLLELIFSDKDRHTRQIFFKE